MNIAVGKCRRLRESLHHLYSKSEDTMFSTIQKIPAKFMPTFLTDWLDRYATKRIQELKQQTMKQAWHRVYLENAVAEISNRKQDIRKAPTEI